MFVTAVLRGRVSETKNPITERVKTQVVISNIGLLIGVCVRNGVRCVCVNVISVFISSRISEVAGRLIGRHNGGRDCVGTFFPIRCETMPGPKVR